MKTKNVAVSDINMIESAGTNKEKALAKAFFPSYLSKIGSLVNLIYKIQPKASFWMTVKLLSATGRKKLSISDIKFYEKGVERKFKVNSNVFCTYTYGSGPPILMLHGWCSNGARWRLYVNRLVTLGYKVVIVDAPGHGNAQGRFLSISLYAKGIKAILESELKWHTILTHSIAGLIAIAAIGNSEKKHHPSKFIMLNTFATGENMLYKFSRCLGISDKVINGTKQWLNTYPEFLLNEFSICKHFNAINTKGLLIYDIKDRVVPRKEAEYIINNVKSLQVIKTEGLGHNLRSKDIVKAVTNFISDDTKDNPRLKTIDTKVLTYA